MSYPLLQKSSGRKRAPLSKAEMKKVIDRDHQMVTGVFRCYEPVGGFIKFSFKKYAGDEVLTYEMFDGQTYTVPRMVATHLNKNCAHMKHTYALDASGNPIMGPPKRIKRCSFESLEFYSEDYPIEELKDPSE